MSEPLTVDPARFFEFIGRSELTVVFVSVHPAHGFNRTLCEYMQAERPEEVVFGSVDFMDLILTGGPALPFLHQGLQACGAPSSYGVLPGYWLFRAGEMLAWDAGLPTVGDASAVARSALLGAIWTGLTRDLSFVGRALRQAAEDVTAQRMVTAFREAATAAPDSKRRQPPPRAWSPADELSRAYQLLGVPPTATDQEVQDAWRKRRVETHPDRAARDPPEFERLSRLSAELNRARDVIFNHRGRDGQRRSA